MESLLREMIDLVLRWMHLVAGIMWIGNSMLFNWLDRNLVKKPDSKDTVFGTMWMVHSGAFYEVEKKLLGPGEVPAQLHWFKWQSYTTWLTGFSLLVVVYYASKGLLVDANVLDISHETGVLIGLSTLLGGFLTYDLLWRTPLKSSPRFLTALCGILLLAVAVGLTQVFSGRAAYLHVGALMGTCMSGNVFRVIIPSQRALMRATHAGEPQDAMLSKLAKERSIHNNYLTFPTLFIMVSNHFSSVYGSAYNWIMLVVAMIAGASVRHFMNIRYSGYRHWLMGALGSAFVGLLIIVGLAAWPRVAQAEAAAAAKKNPVVTFATAKDIIDRRCTPCHAAHPTDHDWPAAPAGVVLELPAQIKALAPRIYDRAVVNKTMPLGNKTQITDAERATLEQWFLQGAPTE